MDDRVPCPHCGHMIKDLWDFEWGRKETVYTECDNCLKPIEICKQESIEYSILPGKAEETTSPGIDTD